MLDPKADELDLSICGRDFTISQSPGLLQSSRGGGTTAAVVWRTSVLFAEWLGSSKNPLFSSTALDRDSTVLELGSGIAGLVPMILSNRVQRIVATDQQYALKHLHENVQANLPRYKSGQSRTHGENIETLPLDWEVDDIPPFLRTHEFRDGVDAVMMCDCIFNYALITPLVDTCTEVCRARKNSSAAMAGGKTRSTICIIAQQLRQPEVFQQWLEDFLQTFQVWRVPASTLTETPGPESGFVIHIGLLR